MVREVNQDELLPKLPNLIVPGSGETAEDFFSEFFN